MCVTESEFRVAIIGTVGLATAGNVLGQSCYQWVRRSSEGPEGRAMHSSHVASMGSSTLSVT